MLVWLQFALCLIVIALAGFRLCRYADVIAEKTGLTGSWIGLALLATKPSRYASMTLGKAVTGYTVSAVVVVAAGAWLPFVAGQLSVLMGWGQSFVGTLLVAAVTSAPELAVTLSALRIGALDMAIASLLGSNLFDILILAVDDLFYLRGPLWVAISDAHALTAFTAVMMSGAAVVGLFLRAGTRLFHTIGWTSLALVALYLLNSYLLYLHAD